MQQLRPLRRGLFGTTPPFRNTSMNCQLLHPFRGDQTTTTLSPLFETPPN